MNILFVAGFSPIVADTQKARALYIDGLELPLDKHVGDYRFTDSLEGAKHFGLWPLSEAAEACFGNAEWPTDIPRPQATVEFELESVEAVAAGAKELEGKDHKLVHGARTEPWGQTVARLLSSDGLLVGLSYAPSLHEKKA